MGKLSHIYYIVYLGAPCTIQHYCEDEDCLVHVPYLSVYIAKRRRISTFVVLYESRTHLSVSHHMTIIASFYDPTSTSLMSWLLH